MYCESYKGLAKGFVVGSEVEVCLLARIVCDVCVFTLCCLLV